MTGKATIDGVRATNRALVLRALRRRGPLSRTSLGEATELSSATVSSITSALIQEGAMVADAPTGAGRRRGRPQVALSLAADAALIAVVSVSARNTMVKVFDFAGRERAASTLAEPIGALGRRAFAGRLIAEVRALLGPVAAARPGPPPRLAHVVVAVQGVTDRKAERVLWSPILEAGDIDLATPFRRRFGVPVTVMNDCSAMVEALHWLQPGRFRQRFAALLVGYGVGMGLYLDGAPLEGLDASAVEFGHMNHMPGGALCRCGRRGCVEAYAASYGLARLARGLPPQTPPAEVEPVAEAEVDRLMAAARRGEPAAVAAYREAGLALGYGLARVFALVGPAPVALVGAGAKAFDLLAAPMREGVEAALVGALRGPLLVDVWEDEAELVFRGAAMTALAAVDRRVAADAGSTPVEVAW